MRNPISVVRKFIASRGEPPRSDKWPAARKKWLDQHPTCAACGGTLNLEVHHKKPFHLFPELELDPANYITLCEPFGIEHHLKVGHTVNGKSSWKLFNPNVVTDAADLLALARKMPQI